MSLLAPLFLLGAAAVLGPLIYHLVRRTTRERLRFSSLLFLESSPPRLAQRQRIEHWWLLLLRCMAILLLVLGFARPFFPSSESAPVAGEPGRAIVLLIDHSASMRRQGLWSQVRTKAEGILGQLGPGDRAEVMVFGHAPRAIFSSRDWDSISPDARVAAALGRLATVAPTHEGTNLGAALVAALDRLSEASAGLGVARREIVVISDFQAGARMEALQTQEWPRDVAVRIEPVVATAPTNAGLQLVSSGDASGRGDAGALRVRVTNAPESTREQFQVSWARADGVVAGAGVVAYVPPGQSRMVRLPPAPAGVAVERVVLQGDDDDFDNVVHVIPSRRRTARVAWLGRAGVEDPKGLAYFLRRALGDTPALAVQWESFASGAGAAGSAPDLAVVGAGLAEPLMGMARGWLEAGATVLAVAESAEFASTLGGLIGRTEVRLSEAKLEGYAMLGEIDFRHPLFSAFADPRFNDFTKIRFWRHRVFDLAGLDGARVVARFDRGAPAVVEIPVGKGRLYVLAAGWGPEDSQLALSSKFVPLLWSLLEIAGARSDAPAQLSVGDSLPLAAGHGGGSLRGPEGAISSVPAVAKELGPFTTPGIYEWTSGGKSERLAVNLDPAESRTSPLRREQLEERGLPAVRPVEGEPKGVQAREQLENSALEARQKIWRWALVAALLALALEMILAGRTARTEMESETSRA
jgi:hypothetical protein